MMVETEFRRIDDVPGVTDAVRIESDLVEREKQIVKELDDLRKPRPPAPPSSEKLRSLEAEYDRVSHELTMSYGERQRLAREADFAPGGQGASAPLHRAEASGRALKARQRELATAIEQEQERLRQSVPVISTAAAELLGGGADFVIGDAGVTDREARKEILERELITVREALVVAKKRRQDAVMAARGEIGPDYYRWYSNWKVETSGLLQKLAEQSRLEREFVARNLGRGVRAGDLCGRLAPLDFLWAKNQTGKNWCYAQVDQWEGKL